MANPTMQSRHLRKGHPVRSSGHAVDKWQDERKVHLGVIFESWKSLREKRADTDPGLAFHLMEIHDQYCFCRFEDAETSDVRDSDVDDSSDIPVHFKQSEDTEETTDRYSDPRSLDSGEYLPKQVRETSIIPNVQSPDQQQHYSPVTESFSRPLNTFQDSPSPTNNETETSEKTGSSQEDSYFSASHKTVQLFDYPSSKSASKESLQPVYVYQNVQEAGTARQSVLGEKMRCNASNSASRVKVEPIDIDSDTDELEHFQHRTENIQTSAVVADATENQNDSVEIKQITTDSSNRKTWTAMNEGFEHLITEEIIKNGGNIYSGIVPQGTFVNVGRQVNIAPQFIEDLWYKCVYARNLSVTNSQSKARSRMKKKISKPELEFIAGLRTGNPNITEMEIKRRLKQDLNVEVSQPTINRAIRQELMFVKWNHKRWQMHK